MNRGFSILTYASCSTLCRVRITGVYHSSVYRRDGSLASFTYAFAAAMFVNSSLV